MLTGLQNEVRTLVFYESVHRIAGALAALSCGLSETDRTAFLGRELTKMHEQCVSRNAGFDYAPESMIGPLSRKGEFVVVVSGSDEPSETSLDVDRLLLELDALLPAKDAARTSAAITGLKKNALYQRLLELEERTR